MTTSAKTTARRPGSASTPVPGHVWWGMGGVAALAAAIAALGIAFPGPTSGPPPAPHFPGVLLAFQPAPAVLLGTGLAASAYLYGVRRVSLQHPNRPWPLRRTVSFLLGLLVVVFVLMGAVGVYDDSLFADHMLQHMVLMLVAPPLLLMGTPVTLLLHCAGPALHRAVLRILHSRPVGLITNPVFTWLAFNAVLWIGHATFFFELALENPHVHVAEHIVFLTVGMLFWWPVLGLEPGAHRLHPGLRVLYLVVGMPSMTFLGLALWSSTHVMFPAELLHRPAWAPPAVRDQQTGGALMWIGGDALYLIGAGIAMVAWMRDEDRRSAHLDMELARQRALSGAPAWQPKPRQPRPPQQ